MCIAPCSQQRMLYIVYSAQQKDSCNFLNTVRGDLFFMERNAVQCTYCIVSSIEECCIYQTVPVERDAVQGILSPGGENILHYVPYKDVYTWHTVPNGVKCCKWRTVPGRRECCTWDSVFSEDECYPTEKSTAHFVLVLVRNIAAHGILSLWRWMLCGDYSQQGVTRRCRLSQLTNSPPRTSPNAGGTHVV